MHVLMMLCGRHKYRQQINDQPIYFDLCVCCSPQRSNVGAHDGSDQGMFGSLNDLLGQTGEAILLRLRVTVTPQHYSIISGPFAPKHMKQTSYTEPDFGEMPTSECMSMSLRAKC